MRELCQVIESVGALAAVEDRIDTLTRRALEHPRRRTDRRTGQGGPLRARQIGRRTGPPEHDTRRPRSAETGLARRVHGYDLRVAEARPALLGFLGAVLITAGGLGAGSTRLHDPLLESLHLSWLRFGHGLVLSSVLLWVGVALMLFAWLWLGRTGDRPHGAPSTRWWRPPASGWRRCC